MISLTLGLGHTTGFLQFMREFYQQRRKIRRPLFQRVLRRFGRLPATPPQLRLSQRWFNRNVMEWKTAP